MGFYADSSPAVHVFLRAKDGTFTSFDPAPGIFYSVPDGSIDPAGSVVGYFFDGLGYQGFLRTPDGTITITNEPNSAQESTWVIAINPSGKIIGYYLDATSGFYHGFVRDRKGNEGTKRDRSDKIESEGRRDGFGVADARSLSFGGRRGGQQTNRENPASRNSAK
jgi:hypothetical protein